MSCSDIRRTFISRFSANGKSFPRLREIFCSGAPALPPRTVPAEFKNRPAHDLRGASLAHQRCSGECGGISSVKESPGPRGQPGRRLRRRPKHTCPALGEKPDPACASHFRRRRMPRAQGESSAGPPRASRPPLLSNASLFAGKRQREPHAAPSSGDDYSPPVPPCSERHRPVLVTPA